MYLRGDLPPHSYCSIIIETPQAGKVGWKTGVSKAPMALLLALALKFRKANSHVFPPKTSSAVFLFHLKRNGLAKTFNHPF